jgi:hypothetical protein
MKREIAELLAIEDGSDVIIVSAVTTLYIVTGPTS